ncbi:D-alanyl-D-alanine carboxypeptidase family protein [Oceanobacillus sp. FSL H7-0719]|uniref:D-alanyl-D-alanine carboxypeptidase family protein n=1 Tax=Oceanobacillus sp. FSL H7-0719 TaxID=2954507 RepID=UPI003254B8C0
MKWKVMTLLILLSLLAACTEEPVNNIDSKGEKIEDTSPSFASENEISLPEESLQKMDEGENVLLLQKALIEIGYELSADSIYSAVTTWAVTDLQLQTEDLFVTGIYDEATKHALESILKEEQTVEPGAALPPLDEPAMTNAGTQVLGNPYDQLAIVNKANALPEDYIPHDLVVPDVRFPFTEDLPKKQLREPAALALEDLFAAADTAGFELYAQSGYRSYERQVSLFNAYTEKHGEEAANAFSARPGESEHQTGLSMDISSASVNYQLVTDFGETPEGQWVEQHAADYGFIIRYPEGKEDITEYQFEPWHLRYVGKKAAQEINKAGVTLEEYFADMDEQAF